MPSPSQQAPSSSCQITALALSPFSCPPPQGVASGTQLSLVPLAHSPHFLAKEHRRPPHLVLYLRVTTPLEPPFLSLTFTLWAPHCALSFGKERLLQGQCLPPAIGGQCLPPAMGGCQCLPTCHRGGGVSASSLSPHMSVCTLGEEVAARPEWGWSERQGSWSPCSEYLRHWAGGGGDV